MEKSQRWVSQEAVSKPQGTGSICRVGGANCACPEHRRRACPLSGPVSKLLLYAVCVSCVCALLVESVRGDFTVQRVLGGLNQPVYVTQAPGDDASLFVVERNDGGAQLGRIRKYDMTTGSLTTFLDVTGTVVDDGGLMGMTFHPDYETNGLFYVVAAAGRTNSLDEYRVVGGAPQVQRRILQYESLAHVWHTIDQAHFRPNGNDNELFVLTGDGGTQANEGSFNPALIESPDSIYGKILRIDLTADFPTPADTANHSGIDVVALGIRNPFRSAFDRGTGDFYFGDVGFTAREEVDFIPASHFANPAAPPLNFGWPQREGTIQTPFPPGDDASPGDIEPIFDYVHGVVNPPAVSGFAVIGGYVYRGPVTQLQGRYFFAEHILGNVYSGLFDTNTNPADYNGANITNIVNHTVDFENRVGGGANIQLVTSFGEDHAGNLYMIKIGSSSCPGCPIGTGEIFRIIPNPIEATVDRERGVISFTNVTQEAIAFTSLQINSAFGAINPAALTPITGHYDTSGNSEIDDNNTWTITSTAGSHTTFREQTTGDAGQIDPGELVVFSLPGGWIPSPTEDLFLSLQLQDGTAINTTVEFIENDGVPFSRSDLNFDNELNADDWSRFLAHHRVDLSEYSLAEAYAFGDLNGDRENDFKDFRLFQADYIAEHGEAAFDELAAQIPEPSALALFIMCAISTMFARRADPMKARI